MALESILTPSPVAPIDDLDDLDFGEAAEGNSSGNDVDADPVQVNVEEENETLENLGESSDSPPEDGDSGDEEKKT